MNPRKIKNVLLIAFALSGMAALMYEVIWARQLTLIFGTTLYAISTVLVVFMAGLALGSLIFGRIVDKSKNPLRIYAYLEGGIGIYVLFTPIIFALINNAQIYFAHNFSIDFTGFSLIRFGLSFIALIIPATLMGGTLPVIVKFFVRMQGELGGYVGKLYALNTLGGVLGSFLVGFALVLLLGVQGTIYLAVAINLLVAAVVFWISRNFILEPVQDFKQINAAPESAPSVERKTVLLVLVAFSFAGFAALSLEASWSRVLAMILGSSVYAFSIILTTFLSGIALGSFIMSRFVDRIRNLLLWFAGIEIAIGVLVIIFTPLFGYLPHLFLEVFKVTGGSFWWLQLMEFLLAGLVMLPPTILMGAAFPIVARICAPELKKIGRSVGNVYFANTLGAIFGPLATGFVLIPLFGLQASILISAFIYLIIGGSILFFSPWPKPLMKNLIIISLIIIIPLSFLIPSWNKNVLNSGVYIYARDYLELNPNLQTSYEQLYYKEGLTATVVVEKINEDHLILRINGKTDASTGDQDMDTELILGHLPMLLHPNPEKVLVIGLGSGITLGAVEQYSELKEVDAVELEPAVVEAASYFSQFNNNALRDPRFNLIITDARNYVLTTEKKYDVITAEPSNPWISGNANLFTKEQYKLYKERLKPGGIMFQWAHLYDLRPAEVKMIVATFQNVFPHTTVWQNFSGTDIFLIGSQEPLKIDFESWREKMAREKVKKDLARVYLDNPFLLLSQAVLDEEGAKNFWEGANIHTDNRPLLELQAPKGIVLAPEMTVSLNLESLEKYRSDIFTLLKDFDDSALEEKIALHSLSRSRIMQGEIYFSRGDSPEKGIAEYEEALNLVPGNIQLKKFLARVFYNVGRAYFKQGDAEKAIWAHERFVDLEPDNTDVRLDLGILYAKKGLLDEAEQEFRQILLREEDSYLAYANLASVYLLRGMNEEAILEFQRSLEINPDQDDVRSVLTQLWATQ